MDRQLLIRLHHLHEVESFQYQHLLDVVNLVGLQNLGELNLGVIPPFLDVEHLHLEDVAVDVEPLHLLKMDYYLDVEDVEPHRLLQMDYYLDVASVQMELAQQVLAFQHFLQRALLLHALQPLPYLQSPLLVQA
jgi:hypothetical protein